MSISESNKSKTKMKYIEAFCTLLNLLFFGEVRTNVGTTVRTNLILIIIQYVIENAFLSWIRVLVANLFLKLSLKLANSLLMDFFVPRSHCCGNLTVQVDFLSVMCVWGGTGTGERERTRPYLHYWTGLFWMLDGKHTEKPSIAYVSGWYLQ